MSKGTMKKCTHIDVGMYYICSADRATNLDKNKVKLTNQSTL